MDRDSGAAVSRFGVARGKRTNRAELEKAHRSGAGCGVGRRRNNGLIGGVGEKNYWEELGQKGSQERRRMRYRSV